MANVYSYIRFSSSKQLLSLDRQLKATHKWCAEHGFVLNTDLNFRDLGVSAFRGKNKDEGALSALIQACEKGKIKPFDYVVVESLDRFSREKLNAHLRLFMNLLAFKIYIVSLQDKQIYHDDTIDNVQLIASILTMGRAHDESNLKSIRVGDAWKRRTQQALENKQPISKNAPAWLEVKYQHFDGRYTTGGVYEIPLGRKKVIDRIFKLYLDGYGCLKIAQMLTKEKVPPFVKKNGKTVSGRAIDCWLDSTISNLISDERLIGTFTANNGQKTEDYFPVAVDKENFWRAQTIRKRKVKYTQRTGAVNNLCAGLIYGRNQERLVYTSSGKKKWTYLKSQNQIQGKPSKVKGLIDYKWFEETFLKFFLTDIALDGILCDSKKVSQERNLLMGKITKQQHTNDAIKAQIENLELAITSYSGPCKEKYMKGILEKLSNRIEALEAGERQMKALSSRHESLFDDNRSGKDAFYEIQTLIKQAKNAKELHDIRSRLKDRIQSVVQSIHINELNKSFAVLFRNNRKVKYVITDDCGFMGIDQPHSEVLTIHMIEKSTNTPVFDMLAEVVFHGQSDDLTNRPIIGLSCMPQRDQTVSLASIPRSRHP